MKLSIRILLLFLCLSKFVAIAGNTQLKIIVFGDTNDPSIGQSVTADIKSYKKLATDIKAAVENDGVRTTLDIYSGDNCSYSQLNEYLNNLSCEDDIILFIYNGHGGRSHADESKYPRMCLASSYESNWMKVSDLNERLRRKNPRLMVVVTDCCNSYYDRQRGSNESAFGASINQYNGQGLRQLFLNNVGEVCITGASPGEYGWGGTNGGMLSLSFINQIYKADSQEDSANWQDLIQTVSDDTYNTSLKYYNYRLISNTQRPVFDVSVREVDYNNSIDNSDNINNDSNNVNNTNDDVVSDANDNGDFTDDNLYEDEEYDEDDYNDDTSYNRSFTNAFLLILLGILFLWIPKKLDLSDTFSLVVRIIGILFFIGALMEFFN